MARPVFIIDGSRTPFIKARSGPGPFTPVDLAVQCGRPLLARRMLNGLQFFTGGARWLCFLPAALLLGPPALLLPFLDFLDRERNFTLGYICTAEKHK
jgi:hypothetical protein